MDLFGWGFILWLVGYIAGILLFFFVPPSLIGWIITPIGTALTVWVLVKKVTSDSFRHYFLVAFAWTLIAVACDYFFLVSVFKPADGYYKLDVYLYYSLTFILPMCVGWYKIRTSRKK